MDDLESIAAIYHDLSADRVGGTLRRGEHLFTVA